MMHLLYLLHLEEDKMNIEFDMATILEQLESYNILRQACERRIHYYESCVKTAQTEKCRIDSLKRADAARNDLESCKKNIQDLLHFGSCL